VPPRVDPLDIYDIITNAPGTDWTADPGFASPIDTKADTCNCPKPKKDKKRKRKPRSICYAGSYRERANGLTKRKREQIPC